MPQPKAVPPESLQQPRAPLLFLHVMENVFSLYCRQCPRQDRAAPTGTETSSPGPHLPACPPSLLSRPHCPTLCCPPSQGLGPEKQPWDSAPNPLHSCCFLTETAWVFMGLLYVKSWRISGETCACKRGRKSLRDGGAALGSEEGSGAGGLRGQSPPPLGLQCRRASTLRPSATGPPPPQPQPRDLPGEDKDLGRVRLLGEGAVRAVSVTGKHLRSFVDVSLFPVNKRCFSSVL